MTAQIIPIRPVRQPSEAERHVIRLAEGADILERSKMMEGLAMSILALKEIVAITKSDVRK